MDLLLGALTLAAIVIAIVILYKRIFSKKRSNVDAEQEISVKEVLGKEVSNMDDQNISKSRKESIHKRAKDDKSDTTGN